MFLELLEIQGCYSSLEIAQFFFFWYDSWVYPVPITSLVFGPHGFDSMMVNTCLTEDRRWNEDFLFDFLPHVMARDILGVFVTSNFRRDRMVWGLKPGGIYYVKSGVKLLQHLENPVAQKVGFNWI